jgi:ubiquinone/menaquinone biosynthesis C-methylase UbiE
VLAVAREKQSKNEAVGSRLRFIKHDVTDLGKLSELEKESFDAILCSNAFVLLENPGEVLRQWREYLKPGGFLVVDIPHEHNMRSGLFLELAARRLGVQHFPSNRVWIKSKDSFREVLDSAGFLTEHIVELEKMTDQRSTYLTVDQTDEQYDWLVQTALTLPLMEMYPHFMEGARAAFKEEFAKAAVNGKVEIVDALYVYVAIKV